MAIGTPRLNDLGIAATGEAQGYWVIFATITEIVKFFGAAWDIDRITAAARLSFDEYGWLTVAELTLFTKRVLVGKYPKQKNFTPAIYMECLTDFAQEVHRVELGYKPPPEIKPISPDADPDAVKNAIAQMIAVFEDGKRQIDEDCATMRKERTAAIKLQRYKHIIQIVEQAAQEGIAPDYQLQEKYFEAIQGVK